ncbi:MAG: peroxidase family protein [Bacteroidota bacterium]
MKQCFTLMLCIGLLLHVHAQENRSLDGHGNNQTNPDWGAAEEGFQRVTGNNFGDGISTPGGSDRPNARDISNMVGAQEIFMPNEKGLSDFVWTWGQFIDHDVNLNDDHPTETFPIDVPAGDPAFDPASSGTVQIPMKRSEFDPTTGVGSIPRKHINEITAFIDGSAVYGVEDDRLVWMRSGVDGKLKVSTGNLLPFNTSDGEFGSSEDFNAPFMVVEPVGSLDKFFIAGDIRANEQPTLAAMHTLWVREHNRLCDEFKAANPGWDDETLFQKSRKMVGAYIQAITYEEWLPAMGVVLNDYQGYDPSVDASIFNVFSAAAYRLGHTLVNGRLLRFEPNGDTLSFGTVNLRDAFFEPTILLNEDGLEPFFRGLAVQEAQRVDPRIMTDLRDFLFGPPGAGGLDLLSINIQRARERGVVDFNSARQDFGLAPHGDFADFISDVEIHDALFAAYGGDVSKIDPWVGFMAEDHVNDAIFGESLITVLKAQFEALRDGDRYYYENDQALTFAEKSDIQSTRLSDIILRNTTIDSIQTNVFFAEPLVAVSVEVLPFREIRNIKVNAFPNPVQQFFTLEIEAFSPLNATLQIFDELGRVVHTRDLSLERGENVIQLELKAALANGMYTINIQSDEAAGQIRILKQK